MPKSKIFGSNSSMLDGPMMDPSIKIVKASNGFILEYGYGEKCVAKTFKEATKKVKEYFQELDEDESKEE